MDEWTNDIFFDSCILDRWVLYRHCASAHKESIREIRKPVVSKAEPFVIQIRRSVQKCPVVNPHLRWNRPSWSQDERLHGVIGRPVLRMSVCTVLSAVPVSG